MSTHLSRDPVASYYEVFLQDSDVHRDHWIQPATGSSGIRTFILSLIVIRAYLV